MECRVPYCTVCNSNLRTKFCFKFVYRSNLKINCSSFNKLLKLEDDCNIYEIIHPGSLKEFSSNWSLLRHLKTHTGEKLYNCHTVSVTPQKCSLKRHEQTHSEAKHWICDHQNCGERFKVKEYLDAHMRTHIQLKPESLSEKRVSGSS
jgi:hypothetical protein